MDELRVWLRSLVQRAAQVGVPWVQIGEELGLRPEDVFIMVSGVDAEPSSWAVGLAVVHPDRPLRVAVVRTGERSRVTGDVIAGMGHIDPVTGYLSLSIRGPHARFENARLGDWLERSEGADWRAGLPWSEDGSSPEAEHRLLLIDAPLDDHARSLAALVGAISQVARHAVDGDE